MMAAFLEEKIAKDPWNIALVSVWYFVLTLYAWPLLFVKKTSRTSFHKQEAMKVVNRSSFLFSFLCKERGQGQQSLAIHFGSFYAHSFAIHVLGYDTQHSCCGNTEIDHITINFVRSNASKVRAKSRYKQMLCSKLSEREREREREISKRCIIESHCSFAAASKPVHQIHRNLQKKSTR
jgi:hypothetical protein